jgi:hypothetical protein
MTPVDSSAFERSFFARLDSRHTGLRIRVAVAATICPLSDQWDGFLPDRSLPGETKAILVAPR